MKITIETDDDGAVTIRLARDPHKIIGMGAKEFTCAYCGVRPIADIEKSCPARRESRSS